MLVGADRATVEGESGKRRVKCASEILARAWERGKGPRLPPYSLFPIPLSVSLFLTHCKTLVGLRKGGEGGDEPPGRVRRQHDRRDSLDPTQWVCVLCLVIIPALAPARQDRPPAGVGIVRLISNSSVSFAHSYSQTPVSHNPPPPCPVARLPRGRCHSTGAGWGGVAAVKSSYVHPVCLSFWGRTECW